MFLPFNSRNTDIRVRPINRPKSKKKKNHVIYRGAEMVNTLPNNIRILPIGPFKKQLKKRMVTHNIWEPDDIESDEDI